MRLILGPLLFTATFFLGTFAAFFSGSVDDTSVVVLSAADEAIKAGSQPAGIRIMYAGSERDTDGPFLKFVVYNGLSQSVSYAAYEAYSPVNISINGNTERIWECQNGTEHFTVAPGRSVELRVTRYDFDSQPRKTDLIAVEFSLWESPHGETQNYLSQPFQLPEDFRRSIQNTVTNR